MKRRHNAARLRGVTPQNTVIIIINCLGSAQLRNDRFRI